MRLTGAAGSPFRHLTHGLVRGDNAHLPAGGDDRSMGQKNREGSGCIRPRDAQRSWRPTPANTHDPGGGGVARTTGGSRSGWTRPVQWHVDETGAAAAPGTGRGGCASGTRPRCGQVEHPFLYVKRRFVPSHGQEHGTDALLLGFANIRRRERPARETSAQRGATRGSSARTCRFGAFSARHRPQDR